MDARVEPLRVGLAILTILGLVVAMIMVFGGAPAVGQPGGGPPEGQVCPEDEDGWSSHFQDVPHTETGDWGQIQFSGEDEDELLTATINEGYVVEICVKQANDPLHIAQYGEGFHIVWDGDLSHWAYRVVQVPPEEPELAEVSVTGACVENDFVVTVSSSNATVNVDLNADGDFDDANETNTADGDYTISAAAGSAIQWEATADSGAEFEGGDTTDSGSVTVLDCEEEEPEPELAEVSVTGACVEDDFVVTVSSSNATVNVDLNADGDFDDANETNTADGDYTISAAAGSTIQWEATADSGAEFEGGDTTDSGSVTVLDCEEEEPEPETGTIVVVKQVAAGDPEDVAFSFNAAGFTLSDDTLAHNESGSAEVAAGGDYSVSETVVDGWEQVSATCESTDEADDSTPEDINVSAGETVTCTFVNQIEEEVLGTTITTSTTVADEVLETEVEVEELPFTGVESDLLLGAAVLMLLTGLLVLGLTGTRDDA